jgi:hypothetical protein
MYVFRSFAALRMTIICAQDDRAFVPCHRVSRDKEDKRVVDATLFIVLPLSVLYSS